MDSKKVNLYLSMNSKNFETSKILIVKKYLEEMDEDKAVILQSLTYKDAATAWLLGIFLAADRVYLGQVGLGIFKMLLSFFVVGLIWWLIDLFTMSSRIKKANFEKFIKIISTI